MSTEADTKVIKLSEKQKRGLASRERLVEIAKNNSNSYLRGILDSQDVVGKWMVVAIKEDGIVLKMIEDVS